MDSFHSERTSLLKKQDGYVEKVPDEEKFLGVNKKTLKKIIACGIIMAIIAVIGYIKLNSNEATLIIGDKIIDSKGLTIEELKPLVVVQDNNEINVLFNKVTSHFLEGELSYLNGNIKFKFDATKEEIEIKYYENNQQMEYFKSYRGVDEKHNEYEKYYFNKDNYIVSEKTKKDEIHMAELHNAMMDMVNNWNVATYLSLLSIKLGSYGLTGQSSHAVRYVHMLSKHIRYLSQHQIIENLPTYFYQMVLDVNQYILFNEQHQLYTMSDEALATCSNNNRVVNKAASWWWSSSSSSEDYVSKAPTKVPTKVPTRVPTKVPTKLPSKIPTRTPTKAPTKVPTKLPSKIPTRTPTRVPTKVPTKLPSKLPTRTPTKAPTKVPTKLPSKLPTRTPTKAPTKVPTKLPSKLPTRTPTRNPTKVPTKLPSKLPTRVPTSVPTPKPTTPCPTPKPTTASPTTPAPTTAKPTTASPTTPAPTTAKPTTASPTTPAPTTAKPTTASPTTAKPTTASPTTASPTTAKPITASPTTAKPTTASPTTAKPTTASPTTAKPTTAKPTTKSPTVYNPCTKVNHDNECLLGECNSNIYSNINNEECSSKISQDECLNEEFTEITNDCYSWECSNCGCGCLCQTYDYACIADDNSSSCCYLIWNWLSTCCDNE